MTIRAVFFAIISSFLLFIVSISPSFAQSCTGTVTCCTQFKVVHTPPGCDPNCDPRFDPYCTQCTSTQQVCTDTSSYGCRVDGYGFCSFLTGASCIGGYSGSCYYTTPTCTWRAWSVCSAACDGGTRTRRDNCGNIQTSSCNTQPCNDPNTCDPNVWTITGTCSVSCGGGTAPTQNECGQTSNTSCNTQACSSPTPGCTWGSWSACSKSCGGGTRSRSDNCGNTETSACNTQACTTCTWGAWSACSRSCGGGTRTRRDNCGNRQTSACNTQACASPTPSPQQCNNNGTCDGFETSLNCPLDCPPQSSFPWWQASGAHTYAGQTAGLGIKSAIPRNCPTCDQQLIRRDLDNSALTDGFPITGGSGLSTNGFTNIRNIFVRGTTHDRLIEGYDYFYRLTDLGENPPDDFAGTAGDASKPTNGKRFYYRNGNLTIQRRWRVTRGETIVVFVRGSLTIRNINSLPRLIIVDPGGFLAFIVTGNINIGSNVGGNAPGSQVPNIEGVYIADNKIRVLGRGNARVADRKFIGAGTFVGHNGVELLRDFDDTSGGDADNDNIPVETFIFRPDFLWTWPLELSRSPLLWQEVN